MEVKNPMKNHIVFTEQVETLLFLFTGLLALGYWRASAVSYGWLFVLRPGWWVRYLISLLGAIPLILLDGAWTNLRTKMRPYNHDYGRYGAPLISEGPHDLQTSRGRSAFFQNLGVSAFSLWVILLAPLSERIAVACYCVLLCIGILTAVFAGIMALKEYFTIH